MGELFLSRGMNVVLADIEQGALNASVSAIAVWGGNSRHFFACLDGYQ
jgi:hypothetical protein